MYGSYYKKDFIGLYEHKKKKRLNGKNGNKYITHDKIKGLFAHDLFNHFYVYVH